MLLYAAVNLATKLQVPLIPSSTPLLRLRAIFVPKFRLPKYLVYHVLDYWAHFGCYYTADPVEAGKKNKIKDKERRKKKNAKSKSKKKGRNFSKL